MIKVSELRSKMTVVPMTTGCYKWWADKPTLDLILNNFEKFNDEFFDKTIEIKYETIKGFIEKTTINNNELFCVYVGQTKLTSTNRGLRGRLGQHINGNSKGSTLRKTINNIKFGRRFVDEQYIDSIIDELYLEWFVSSDNEIDFEENLLINRFLRILNSKANNYGEINSIEIATRFKEILKFSRKR